MADSFTADGRARARLLVLCAVLLGLFLMHGAPAGATGGCHGMVEAPASTQHAHEAPMAPQTSVGVALPGAVQVGVADGTGSPGALCVSTPARDRIAVPAASLVAAVALAGLLAWSITGRRWSRARGSRRGPPDGRGLLLQVCVART
jgi:hypothetical protein